jgi:hypothetical protein
MADHYYGINRSSGLDPNRLQVGTSTFGTDLELRSRDGQSLNRLDILNGLKVLTAYFSKGDALVVG